MLEQKYKKYVTAILCSFFILYGLSVIWVMTGYFCPQNDTIWVNNLYQHKEGYARGIHEPKIVIVSGSSGLYGVSAEQIERHFKIPAVNLSTHAGLRDYYFYRARKNLRSNDLVILAPEYGHYFSDDLMSDIKSDYILNYDRSCLTNLPVAELFQILKTYAHPGKIMRDSFSFFIKQHTGIFNFIDGGRTLNTNGDIIGGFGEKYTIDPFPLVPSQFDPEKYGMKKISEFIGWCDSEGIRVLVSWPGTLPLTNTFQNDPYNMFTDPLMAFLSHSGVEILGQPKDFFMPESCMFNTIYHLNPAGIQCRTSKIIGFLEKSVTFQTWRQCVEAGGECVSPDRFKRLNTDFCYNGDMELPENNKISGWQAITGDPHHPDGIAVWDNTEVHGGQYSLQLRNTSGRQIRWAGKKVVLPSGVRNILAGGWSKALNIEETATYCINIQTFFKDGSFQWNTDKLFFSKGSHDWEQIQTVIHCDKEIVAIQPFLILYSSTSGTAWFDDIFIRMQPEAGAGI